MKKHYLYILFFLFTILSMTSWAQDSIKVLFIGNSFTSHNDLPNLFSQLVQGSGKNVVVASYMPGGISVGDISQGSSAHMNNPLVFSLIRSNNWDYLVLQDNQGRFCLGSGIFPSSSLVIKGHLKIRDSLLYYHPCAHVIWYAGFGPKNDYPPYGYSGTALIDSIYKNYQLLNDTANQIIAPIGPAFKRIISGYPSINLWDTDDTHPSLHGSFLTACVIYTTILKSSAIISSFNPGIPSSEDAFLKNTASQTTLDSLLTTGLIGITPLINQIGNTLSVSNSQNCEWFYNNAPYTSVNCLTTINQSGDYYAVITDSNACEFKTLEQTFNFFNLNENNLDTKTYFSFYPNPADEMISFNKTIHEALEISFCNITGETVWSQILESGQNQISTSNLKKGIYMVHLKSKGININQKLIIQR